MNLRLFYALWPDLSTRATLAGEDRTLFAGNGGKMVSPDDYHLTLRFLGTVGSDALPDLEDLGERAARVTAPSLVDLDMVEWWREPAVMVRIARVTPAPLQRLDELLTVGLKAAGIATDPKPLKLHLTLVRGVKPHPLGTGACPPLSWSADALALVESTGAAKGPRYKVRKQWPFQGMAVG